MKKYLLLSLCLLLGLGAFAQRSSNRVLQVEKFSEKNSVYERSSDVEVLIEDDFSAYTVGDKLAQSAVAVGNDWWTTWSNAPGSSEDGKIVEKNGNKCAYLKYGNDQVLKLGATQSGVYDLEFDIMVPSGGSGYFNILHEFISVNSTWAMQAYLHMTDDGQYSTYAPGHGTVHAGSNNTADVAAIYDEWMHFRLHVDTDADEAKYYYTTPDNEEVLVCTWQWSLDSFGENIVGRELDAMNFFPPDSNSEYYLDNFKYTRIGGKTAAELVFNPDEINETIGEDDMTSVTISIENNGTSIGDYSAWVDYGVGQGGDNEEIVSYAIDSVSNPSGLTWNSDEPVNFEIAALFPATAYGNSVMGTYITKAAYMFCDWVDQSGNPSPGLEPRSDVIFRIYGQGRNGNPGEILAEKVIAAEDIATSETELVYTEVEFDEPVALTGYDVYVAVEMTAAVEGTVMTLDGSGQAVQGYGDIYRQNDGAFKSITDNSGTNYGNWCLYMVCEGAPIVGGYATLDKTSGTLPIGGSDEVTLNLSSVGLAEGSYNAFVKFATNDPAASLVSIPINLLVDYNDVNVPTDPYITDAVMYTTYDFQSNGQVSNRMYHREDGSVAVVATMSHEYDQSASDRGTIYNFFDGNSWGDYPYERAEANATGYDMRTGWPSIAPYGENGEILVNHSDGLNYYIRETAGEGLWDGPYSIPAFDYSYSLSWPRVVTSGENNEIIHVVAAAQNTDNNGNTVTTQFYCRSTDGENWEVNYSPLVETNEHIGIYSADDYCVSANGDVVAVVYATPFHGDVLMFKSTDNGLSWTKYVVWENPYKGNWETDDETITEDVAQTPTMSTVAVGPDGVVHVAFSVANYVHSELGTTFSYYHGRAADGIAYWNDRREPLGNLSIWNPDPENEGYLIHSNDNINFCGWMPFYENIGGFDDNMIYRENDYIYTFYGACSGYPALSVDPDGNLALAYSTIDMRRNNGSHYYRSVFVSYKAAENEGWNVAVEDLTEDFMFTQTEAISVSAASVSAKENEFWFSFLGDDTHGFYQGADASQSSASDNYVYVSKFIPGEYGDDDDDNNDEITQAYRKVLIETFTGRNSSYEPDAHKIANELAAANPERVFPVNIHCGGFSPTSSPNMNTTVGTEMLNAYNVQGFPCGNINRNSESPISRGEWSSETYNQLSQRAEVNVSGLVKINPLDRVAEITVDLEYSSSGNYNTNYLTVMMLQDSIWGPQSGGSSNPEQYVNGQYCHMHVLRDVITPTWGDAVSPTTAGTHITKKYIYEIPEIIGNPNGVDVDLDNIYFLAFVTETYQGTPTRPVLNVDKLNLAFGDPECDAPTDLTYYIDEFDYNNVILSWSAPAGADSANVTYEIYSSSTSMTPLYYGITETSFTIEDLDGGNYRYFVKANWNDECLSDPSNMVEVTIADCAPDDMIELRITMSDQYGDGWNGGYIEIVGETNGSTYTVTLDNESNGEMTLSLCPDVYYFSWNNGSYDTEVGFEIFVGENEVYSVAEGTIDNSFSNPFFVLRFEDIFASISDVTYTSAFCSTETNFNINVINEGMQEITSLKMEAVVDGNNDGGNIEFTWQGSIPSYQSANIETTLDLSVGYHNVDFRIVEINGVPFETSKSINVNVEEGIDTYVNGDSGEYTIDVMTNGYGGTLSWEIIASDNSVINSGVFSNNETRLNTETVTIPAGECVRLFIRNSNNNFNSGYYRIFDGKGNVVVYNEGNFGYEQSYLLSVISDDNMDDSYAENTFNVNVDVPGTLSYKLAAVIEHWSDVYVLKVNGELNTSDFDVFSKLTHLMTLDLTQTDITSIDGCKELSRLRNVYLPATVTNVNNQAFYNCKSLYSINLPNATTIEYIAFYNCYSLASINIPNVTSIDYDAFYYCQSLTSIDISNATNLSNNNNYGIFGYCTNLSEVILSDELTYIPYECFYYCTSLQEINLPASLKTIDRYAFYGCALTDINIPEGVTSIANYAFNGCPATTISIPSSITSIGSNVFSNGNITDVYCYAATPVTTSTFNGGLSYATLHVPEFSVVAYKVHDSWYKFNIVALDELLSDVYINSDYTIVDYNGLADEVNLTLDRNAHLTVTAGSEFNLNNYKQITSNTEYYEYDNNWNYTHYYPSTLITYNEMNADNVEVSLVLLTDRWNFISLPFDVNVSDITYPEGTLWVVRKYSGEDRANMTGNTWHNMTDGMTLNAGEGYILHCDHGNTSYVTFTFPAVNNESMNNMFTYQDFEQHLEIYPSEFAHNRSWNLVGNPYPSYFNTNGNIEHNGIITVWDNAYVAYSLLDDYFTLKPYESFFVQCPDDATSMLFKTEGRSHTNDYDDYSKRDEAFRQRNSGDRKIYNFTLNNEEYSDRTRLVLNEAASVDYELSCDASKFMNEDENVPQIYVYDSEVLYAINERPLGLGVMSLGIRIGQAGEYTMTLDPKEEYGQKVVLYDNETREEIDILNGSYTFFAEEGYDNDRFVLTITENTIGIDEDYILDINDPDVEVYDIYGRRVRVSDAKNGLYILRKGDMVQRYFISE